MPHWMALVVIVAVGWLVVAVLAGTVLGRVLERVERWYGRTTRTAARRP